MATDDFCNAGIDAAFYMVGRSRNPGEYRIGEEFRNTPAQERGGLAKLAVRPPRGTAICAHGAFSKETLVVDAPAQKPCGPDPRFVLAPDMRHRLHQHTKGFPRGRLWSLGNPCECEPHDMHEASLYRHTGENRSRIAFFSPFCASETTARGVSAKRESRCFHDSYDSCSANSNESPPSSGVRAMSATRSGASAVASSTNALSSRERSGA